MSVIAELLRAKVGQAEPRTLENLVTIDLRKLTADQVLVSHWIAGHYSGGEGGSTCKRNLRRINPCRVFGYSLLKFNWKNSETTH